MNNKFSTEFAYINYTLTIKFNINDATYEIRLTSWDLGIEVKYIVDGEIEPDSDLIKSYGINLLAIIDSDAGKKWFKSIPDDIGKELIGFENATGYGLSIPTLIVISSDEYARELFLNDYLLFWIIMTTAFEFGWDYISVKAICSLDKKSILDICGFADSKAFHKMMHRIKLGKLDLGSYRFLNNKTHKINYSKINHIKNLDKNLLSLLCEFPFLYNAKFIHTYSCEQHNALEIRLLIKDVISMAEDLQIQNIEKVLCQIHDLRTLENLHDRWARKLNESNFEHLKEIKFPQPPKRGTEDIIPIENAYELAIEGQTQSHCVRTYQREILTGDYYVYRVLAPERATVGLKRQNGEWLINQIRLRSNNNPSEETVKAVQDWFYSVNQST